MKLISDIINELVDSEKSISSPLLKTKVLASRLGNSELLSWVNQELGGYAETDYVPEYRKYSCNVIGDYINGSMQYTRQPVYLSGLSQKLQDQCQTMIFMQSVVSLETLNKDNTSGSLELSFPGDFVKLIQATIVKMGNPYFQLINAKKYIGIAAVVEILSVVRNRLLDFMLKVDSEFGDITEIEELKDKQKEISHIMNQTIINNSGDGNVVNTGSNSKINSTITISKDNKNELKDHLTEMGIDDADSSELLSIIDEDVPNEENPQFGAKVKLWIQKMIGKSLDGTWNVGIGAAGTLLADAIMKYYGL